MKPFHFLAPSIAGFLLIWFSFGPSAAVLAQTHSTPVALNVVNVVRFDNDERYQDIRDVWGINIESTHYALATLRRDGTDGLAVIDVSTPSAPSEHLFVDLRRPGIDDNRTVDVETYEKGDTVYAYVARDAGRLEVINLTGALNSGNPVVTVNDAWVGTPIDRLGTAANPYPVGSTENRFARTHTLNIAGDYLYVGSQTRYVDVWHLGSNPMRPSKVGVVEFTVPIGKNRLLGQTLMADPNTHGDSVHVRLPSAHELYARSTGNHTARLYLAFSHGGLHVADVHLQQGTSPADEYNNYIHKSFHVRQLYDRDRVYPAQIQSGDELFDLRGTHSAWPTDDGAYVFTTDEANYPINTNEDLASDAYPPNWARADTVTGIWEVTDPTKPRLSGYDMYRRDGAFLRIWKTSELGNTSGTALKGGYDVPESVASQGVVTLSGITPSDIPNTTHQLFIRGNRAFIAGYTQGVRMLDITNPEQPAEFGYYDPYPAMTLSDYRDRVWQGFWGVFPDPDRPGIFYGSANELRGVGPAAVSIFKAVDPELPEHVPHDLILDRNVVLTEAVHTYAGTLTFRKGTITTTQASSRLEPVPPGQFAQNLVVSGQSGADHGAVGSLHAPGTDDGERKKRLQVGAYPNPFNPATTIRFDLPEDGRVLLDVFDVLGRLVARLFDAHLESGSHAAVFDAAAFPSGLYFYRFRAGDEVRLGTIMLVK